MEAFGRALRKIPTIICDNAGMGAADVITQLRAAGAQEERSKEGVDVIFGGGAGRVQERRVLERLKVKQVVIMMSATEDSVMVLRVDESIHCAHRKREGM
jgi:T-complex protein 1 subunit beta